MKKKIIQTNKQSYYGCISINYQVKCPIPEVNFELIPSSQRNQVMFIIFFLLLFYTHRLMIKEFSIQL